MRKLFSLNRLTDLRKIPVFGLTLIIGLWLAGAFEAYYFHFYIEKRFTTEQGANLIGKKVVMHRTNGESKPGTVVSISPWGSVEICCTTIERKENATIGYSKSSFDSFVTVMDD